MKVLIWHFFVFALFGVINGIKKYLCKGSAGSIALTFAEVLMFWACSADRLCLITAWP